MVNSKRFNNKDFKAQLDLIIDQLIEEKQMLSELHKRDIQVSEIALKFNVTTNTLRRWCLEHFNMPARDYLLDYRINKAKRLLIIGERPSIVSKKLAFAEHKTFSTAFKRACKLSPKEYYRRGIDGLSAC